MSGAAYVSSHVEVIAISVPIQLYCSAVHQVAVTNVVLSLHAKRTGIALQKVKLHRSKFTKNS